MTQDTNGADGNDQKPSGSGTNWVTIAIVAGIVIAVLAVLFGVMNRRGDDSSDGELTTPAPAARITIVEPVNGTVLDISAPFTVSGTGEGLPEGNVVVEALDAAGNVLSTQATNVVASDAGIGGSGPWSVQMTVNAAPGSAGSIRASSPSPADGSIVAEVAVGVLYGVAPPPAQPQITINIPLQGEIVSAQEVVVVGTGSALPENNVVVRALNAGGEIMNEQAATVDAELGGTGEWRAILRYAVAPGTLGRIYAFAPSPADGSIMAEAAVDVQYGTAVVEQPAISIEQPVQGQIVEPGQFVVSGVASALPENNVVVRALDGNGALLSEQATTVNADLGASGPWSVTVSVNVPAGTPGRIIASSNSPADGSLIAEAPVDVVYGAPAPSQPAISIATPQENQIVDPTQIDVSGTGTALPENNVVVRVYDENGVLLAEEATVVDAPLGGTGSWAVSMSVEAVESTLGRVEASSTSPADGSVVAAASVNIEYGRGRD